MKKKFKIKVEGKEFLVEVESVEEENKEGELGSKEKKTSIKEKEPYGKFESITTDEKSIFAPLPAKVIRVNCKAGEKVRKGEILMILEAMKVENETRSPTDSTINEVLIEQGAPVSPDAPTIVRAEA